MFVGRIKETAAILRAIGRGENVIVSGKFGIGRTSLIRHVASLSQDHLRFLFVDFALSANKACETLIGKLLPRLANRRQPLQYKVARYKLAHYDGKDKRRQILVLDNIAKLSSQKLEFIRCLQAEKHFLFVAIVEQFLSSESLLKLRGMLFPSLLMDLGYLSIAETIEYFKQASKVNKMDVTDSQIKHWATLSRGYPLIMTEDAGKKCSAKTTIDKSIFT